MPKALSDQDRLLAFAFRATDEQLEAAKKVIDAAIRAKGGTERKLGKRPVKPAATPNKASE